MPSFRSKINTHKSFAIALLVGCLSPADVVAGPESTQSPPSSSAGADGKHEAADPCLLDTECRLLTENARSLSAGGKYSEALTLYEQAYKKQSVPWLLMNMGRVLQKQKQYDRALSYYQKFTSLSTVSPELKSKAEEYIRQIQAEKQSSLASSATLLPEKKTAESRTPAYKQWWPWTILGVAVAGAGVGVGLYFYSRQPNLDGLPEIRPLN
jgi:tetratricopeptide (TPR) repeat protein